MSKKKKKNYIDYYSAVHWFNPGLVLFNQIKEFDPDLDDEEIGENGNPIEVFQYFLTSLSDDDAEYMKKFFPDVWIVFSEKLEVWVLLVPFWGTAWDGQFIECHLDWVERSDDSEFNKTHDGDKNLMTYEMPRKETAYFKRR